MLWLPFLRHLKIALIPRLIFQKLEIKVGNKKSRLRRIGYRDKETGKHYKYLTNRFDLSAKTITEIYKERWQIELFFKEIKQNLKIKKFVGNSENAVMIQIYTALTIYLLLAYQKFLSKSKLSIKKILELVTLNLLETTNLENLLNPQLMQPPKKENLYNCSMLKLIA